MESTKRLFLIRDGSIVRMCATTRGPSRNASSPSLWGTSTVWAGRTATSVASRVGSDLKRRQGFKPEFQRIIWRDAIPTLSCRGTGHHQALRRKPRGRLGSDDKLSPDTQALSTWQRPSGPASAWRCKCRYAMQHQFGCLVIGHERRLHQPARCKILSYPSRQDSGDSVNRDHFRSSKLMSGW
jgi:hypothetical protein